MLQRRTHDITLTISRFPSDANALEEVPSKSNLSLRTKIQRIGVNRFKTELITHGPRTPPAKDQLQFNHNLESVMSAWMRRTQRYPKKHDLIGLRSERMSASDRLRQTLDIDLGGVTQRGRLGQRLIVTVVVETPRVALGVLNSDDAVWMLGVVFFNLSPKFAQQHDDLKWRKLEDRVDLSEQHPDLLKVQSEDGGVHRGVGDEECRANSVCEKPGCNK